MKQTAHLGAIGKANGWLQFKMEQRKLHSRHGYSLQTDTA